MPYAKSEATKRELIESTARLVRTDGYHGVGVTEILERSGVPRGSLYHHFPGGKEELAAESVRFSTERIVEALEALAAGTGDPVEAMRAFCDFYIAQLETSGYTKGCPLATVALDTTGRVASVHEATGDGFRAIIDFFARELENRGLATDAAVELATFTVSSIEGALLVAKATTDTAHVTVVRDRLAVDLRRAIEEAA